MKLFFFFIFIIYLFSSTLCLKEAKVFFIEFLKTITNENVTEKIAEQCLDDYFDYSVLILQKNIIENDFESLSRNYENLMIDIFLNCQNIVPLFKKKEIKFINKTSYDNIFSPNFLKTLVNIYSNALKEYQNPNKTSTSLGRAAGKIFNLLIFDSDSINENDNIISNKSQSEMNNEDYLEFVGGMFNGMKKIEDNKESECYKDIIKGKEEILENLEFGRKELEKGESLMSTITKTILALMGVDGLIIDCNLLSLTGKIISKFTSIKEFSELSNRIIDNSANFILYIGKMFENFSNGNYKETGKYFGKIISNIFDFYVK